MFLFRPPLLSRGRLWRRESSCPKAAVMLLATRPAGTPSELKSCSRRIVAMRLPTWATFGQNVADFFQKWKTSTNVGRIWSASGRSRPFSQRYRRNRPDVGPGARPPRAPRALDVGRASRTGRRRHRTRAWRWAASWVALGGRSGPDSTTPGGELGTNSRNPAGVRQQLARGLVLGWVEPPLDKQRLDSFGDRKGRQVQRSGDVILFATTGLCRAAEITRKLVGYIWGRALGKFYCRMTGGHKFWTRSYWGCRPNCGRNRFLGDRIWASIGLTGTS